jgi:hypothetical protein
MEEKKGELVTMVRKTGFLVYVYSEKRWFPSLPQAKAYALRQENYCDNVQIISCVTGEVIYGRKEDRTSESSQRVARKS